jgi:hypothetical protein
MKTASWILLAIVGVLVLLGSLVSLSIAYRTGAQDPIAPRVTLDDVAAGRPEVATALRGRRATAAAFAAAYAVLFLSIVLGPYRRGDTWSWWTLLAGSLTLAVLTAARVPALGTRAGAGTGLVQLAVVVVALLLDLGRVRGTAVPATAPPAP